MIGGVETFMVTLATALGEAGHECELFFFQRGPMEQELTGKFVAHFGSLADCLRVVDTGKFEIVHGCSTDWGYGISAARYLDAKLVITAHHDRLVPVWNSTNCDALAGCSHWLATAQQPLTDLSVHTVYNGIDTEQFRPAAEIPSGMRAGGGPIIAWVGRGPDLRAKRIDKLAAIAPMLYEAGIRLWLAESHGFEQVAAVAPDAALALRETAEFWAHVPRTEIANFYRKVAVSGGCIISTSYSEGFGLAIVEAQACGCPTVGTDVRGVNEVISPAHGGVLFPFDMEAGNLARLVIETVSDKERMRERRRQSFGFAHTTFSAARMAKDYLRIYEEILRRPRRNLSRTHARFMLAPLANWREYVAHRWSAGQYQYEMSRQLAAHGESRLASAAARASIETCPTLYGKPQRLSHLFKTMIRPMRENKSQLKPGGGRFQSG